MNPMDLTEMQLLQRLAVALGIGLLIGAERGWAERNIAEGGRIAGIRTFGLVALLGAVWVLLSDGHAIARAIEIGLGFFGLAMLLTVAHWLRTAETQTLGITTEAAALLTFALGAIAMQGHLGVAASVAVVATILLGLKPTLHAWLARLEPKELHAALKLLLISVVVLPVLPDRGFGPWQAFNPYEIWWMVVLVAGISFVGYVAIKAMGPSTGVMLAAVSAGLVASTAATLHLSRLARREPAMGQVLAAAIVTATATVFPRIGIITAVVEPALCARIAVPLILMALCGYGIALWQWKSSAVSMESGVSMLQNPFDLKIALQFGALLAFIALCARALQAWLGDRGLYLLSGVSGLSDVDAITLSVSRLVSQGLEGSVGAWSIMIAVMVNTVVKAMIAIYVGRRTVALRVGASVLAILFSGMVGLGLMSR
ncbi:MAG: MgtC/SapB family protein [Gammaproteobacteria bacterium]